MKTLLLSFLVLSTGCASVKPGHDSLIVHANQSKRTLVATADSFLKIEKDNRAYFWSVSKSIKATADGVRASVPEITKALDGSVDRYRAYKSHLQRADLELRIGIVTSTIADITTAYTKAQENLKAKR